MSDTWLTPAIGIGLYLTTSNTQQSQINDFFSSTSPTQSMKDNIAASALANAMNAQKAGNLNEAVKDYTLSIGLSPYSDNSIKAYQLLSGIYQKQGNANKAINLLKQAQAVFPQSDTIDCALGDIYYGQKNYSKAIAAYSKAAAENPGTSSDNYSLGQAYMAKGDYASAEIQFKMVARLQPKDSSSYYALGQLYHKMGNYNDAIMNLNKALRISPKDTNTLLELGETYADMKNFDAANKQLAILNAISSSSLSKSSSKSTTTSASAGSSNNSAAAATILQAYISNHADPKITSVYGAGFNSKLGPGTKLTAIDSAYSQPNSSEVISLNFTFNKDMNPGSVQNVANWQIFRSSGADPGGAYNFGLPISDTEVSIAPMPIGVSYNSGTRTATVQFIVAQNAAGNGTIDPEHIMFKFSGKDAFGNSMDSKANEYSGISQIS